MLHNVLWYLMFFIQPQQMCAFNGALRNCTTQVFDVIFQLLTASLLRLRVGGL